jgi:hypothetical protein
LNQEHHLKGEEAGAGPEQLRRESPRHQKQLLQLHRRWLPSAEEVKAIRRQADRHNVWHRPNRPLPPRPLNPHANPEDDASVALPAPLPDNLAVQVRRRQGGRENAALSKLALRQLNLRTEVEKEEGRERTLVGRPLVKLPLQLSAAGRNPRAERKKVRKPRLRLARNNASLI